MNRVDVAKTFLIDVCDICFGYRMIKNIKILTSMYIYQLLLLLLVSTSIAAQTTEYNTGWQAHSYHSPIAVRFMLTGRSNPVTKTVEGLLEIKLDDGWKTYWRTPGEGGEPPKIDWNASVNLKHVDWYWPTPTRYKSLGMEMLGYKGDIIFPMILHIDDMKTPVQLDGILTLSSCKTVCLLTEYPINFTFIPDNLSPSINAIHLYQQAINLTPSSQSQITLEKATWNSSEQIITLILTNHIGWLEPDIFVDTSKDDFNVPTFSAPKTYIKGNQLTAIIHAENWSGQPELFNKTLSLVVSDQGLSAVIQAPLTAVNIMNSSLLQDNLLGILMLALLGGLILNIMPCVLPVLGMKLNTVLAAKGMHKKHIRQQFLASAAGILISFWLLSGFLTFLKLSGQALGWGIQFQNIYFIGFMALVTGLFAANMLGLFEIQLPSRISTWLATQGNDSLAGHFIQGMFATLLATPCSAPFLGTAVAFAFSANIVTLFIIFTALAIGMAAPWLLIAALPQLVLLFPKPGQWMNSIKWVFALMMLTSSLWLLSLMISYMGILPITIITMIGLGVLISGLWQKQGKRSALITSSFVLLVVGITVATHQFSSNLFSSSSTKLMWQPLNTEVIYKSVKQGKTVFVDITADWCITCKANELGVITQEPVYSKLKNNNIILLKGDWTKASEAINKYLQSHGKYGVPFNIVYGPNAPEGITLPVILTKKSIMDAIKTANDKDIQLN